RAAPFVAAQPQLDSTDLYGFVSPDKADTVTLISNWIPFEEPAGGPNFYPFAPGAHYDINIDNNGDAKPDITYRWTFKSTYRSPDTFLYNTGPVNNLNDPTLNFVQTYNLDVIKGGTTTNLLTDAPVIGVWTTAEVPSVRTLKPADGTSSDSGDYVQVSRLGMPLVNEVVVPAGAKDKFNNSKPENDTQFLPKVDDPEVPKLIE